MIRLIVTYLATAISFAAVDYVWLSQIGPKVYHPTLDSVLRPASDPVDLPAAVVFYLAYIAGLVALAVWPRRNEPLMRTTLTGAILGAMCYATYDLTNQATLRDWPWLVTLVDLAWGTFASAIAGAVACRAVMAWKDRRA